MLPLSELSLKVSYHKGQDDIARDFYLPCMERAQEFDRAVGYFRSTVFIIAWPALKGFIDRGGKIQVLCSQVLSDEDVDALEKGYAGRADELLETRIRAEVTSLLEDEVLHSPARVLAGLVATGTLDLQIAVFRQRDLNSAKSRIFHDKLGIFRDPAGNRVVFKGSMNETWSGLSADGNLESVDVAASWLGGRDLERCDAEESYFADLWTRQYPDLLIRPFPEVARNELARAAPADLQQEISSVAASIGRAKSDSRGRVLKSHQSLGLASWAANSRRGILAFATGAGKTFTAITAIRAALTEHGETVIVVVPDNTLFRQWDDELRDTLADLEPRILRAGAGHDRWSTSLRQWTQPAEGARLVLATVQTAASEAFRDRLVAGRHLMIVADEVHRLGSRRNRLLMDEGVFGPRLGLSATPERFGDPDGTNAILSFFGGILHPRYTLADAIRDRVLTPYFYRPHAVHLNPVEADDWIKVTNDISRLLARIAGSDSSANLSTRLQHALFARARIIKQATSKIDLAIQVLSENYRRGDRWLVYCDDSRQLAAVEAALDKAGLGSIAYHSDMEGGRAETLRWLERRGGIITAIKCLDEGVDIPSVSHALILASSKNPREFVQRRGRVLRRAEGKALANIHDAIIVPPAWSGDEEDRPNFDTMTAGEIARAIEFATHAENPAAAADLKRIAVQARIDWTDFRELGAEDAEH